MDPKIVESELRNHKIREGPIYKRTKFLQEWRQRWMVLSMNYILIFTSRNLKELAEFIDLRQVKTYKSYLRKDEDMIPAGFKIRTQEEMFYFCARNCHEKWTWIVSLERLMDFKYAGKSPYNNAEWIRAKGFMGQAEFERGKFDEPQFQKPKEVEKPKEKEKPKEAHSALVNEAQLQRKLTLLDEEMVRLRQKEQDMMNKEREQEEIFLFELNKLKKTEESLKEIQLQVQEKAREAERILSENQPRQIIKEVYIQKPVQVYVEKQVIVEKPVEVIVEKQVQVIVEKKVEVPVEKPAQVPAEKQVEKEPQRSASESPEPVLYKHSSGTSKLISDMKSFFESKNTGGVAPKPTQTGYADTKPKQVKKEQKKEDVTKHLHLCRDKVVINLIEEFHPKSYSYPGLKFILQFLVSICADRSLGYQSYLIREVKANENRFLFAEVLLQLINDYKKYDQFGSLAKIVQVLIFEAPGIFKLNHFDLIKRKLVDLVYHAPENHPDVPVLLKTLYVVHKMKSLEKNPEFKEKLTALSDKMSSGEAKNWAKKLIEDL